MVFDPSYENFGTRVTLRYDPIGSTEQEATSLFDVRVGALPASARVSRRGRHARSAIIAPDNLGRSTCACGGGCPRCAVQPKLAVGASHDPLEREADRIAARVMRGADVVAAPAPSAEPIVRRSTGATSAVGGGQTSTGSVARTGEPLPSTVRAFFEPRFGRDFSDVRIHTDAAAAHDNAELGSRAFTHRNHIALARDEALAPTELLAHELAHVVQNDGASTEVVRRKEDWDFTPQDYATLKKGKGDVKFAADSSWVPKALQENVLNTVRYMLDAKRSPAATEGVNIYDFYHGHLVVPDNKTGLTLDASDARSKFKKEMTKLKEKTLGSEFGSVDTTNIKAFKKGLAKTLPLFATAVDEVVKIKGAAVVYHTFERTVPKDLAAKKQGLGG